MIHKKEEKEMTSKETERKALAQIRKIVEGLGENSYIGMAFEGCFEIAERNIENDWGCSMLQRATSAEQKLELSERENKRLNSRVLDLQKTIDNNREYYQAEINKLGDRVLLQSILEDVNELTKNEMEKTERMMKHSAEHIVEMADTPNDIGFQQAVKNHRNEKKLYERLFFINDRVNYALRAYDKKEE